MIGFGKVFSSLWTGSMRGKPDEQLVFAYMLCNCDGNGVIDVSHQVIVDATGLPMDRVVAAVEALSSPDGHSRTPDMEGRRITLLDSHRDWGWQIVNHLKYRGKRDPEERKEQNREAQRRWRERHSVSKRNQRKPRKPESAQAEAEAEAEAIKHPCPSEMDGGVGEDGQETPKQWAEGFDAFWQAYPRKVARKAAEGAYMKLKPRTQATYDLLFAGLEFWKREWEGRDLDKVPHASTWLNQRRYADAEAAETR